MQFPLALLTKDYRGTWHIDMHPLCRVVVVCDEQVANSMLTGSLGRLPQPGTAPEDRCIPVTLLDLITVDVTYATFTVYSHPFTPAACASNLCIRYLFLCPIVATRPIASLSGMREVKKIITVFDLFLTRWQTCFFFASLLHRGSLMSTSQRNG